MNRPRGWIQDSGSLENLIKVVELFDDNSLTYSELIKKQIPKKVKDNLKKNQLIESLQNDKIDFNSLVGSRTSSNVVDGIIQCLISGQSRLGIVDWACDNFVRFAYTLDFIDYDESIDSYFITDFGLRLTRAKSENEKFKEIKSALKKYPPVIRVLELLYKQFDNQPIDPSLTKFEIGKNLGFKGEDGFTTYSQNVFIQALNSTESTNEKSKIKQNWEGSSDKYARMICGWLMHENIAWVKKTKKIIEIQIGEEEYSEKLMSYQITVEGIKEFRSARAYSSKSGITKNVSFEMLATKGADRDYLRTRRAYILLSIHTAKTIEQIQRFLDSKNLKNISIETIKDDLKNFERIGLEISFNGQKFKLKDRVTKLFIPELILENENLPSRLETVKQLLREELKYVDYEYLDILDLSVSGRKSAIQFEVRIVDLLNKILIAKHLSGGNRPEIVGYNPNQYPEDCFIMDSKAYADGFSIPANERDKMIRYIEEFNAKDENLNSNKWWENFKSPEYPVNDLIFAFVSGSFIGKFIGQLEYIKNRTGNNGCAITAEVLLKKVDDVLNENNNYELKNFFTDLSCGILMS